MFSSSSNVISVPERASSSIGMSRVVKLDSTRSCTLYLPANSTERICSTFEPRLAISSISSKVMRRRAGAPPARCADRWCRRRRRRCRSGTRRPSAPRPAPRADVSEPPRPSVVMLPSRVDALEARRRRRPCRRRGRRGSRASSMLMDARLGERAVGEDAAPARRCSSAPSAHSPAARSRAARSSPARRSTAITSSSRGFGLRLRAPWRGRAAGWSRRSSPKARRPADARPRVHLATRRGDVADALGRADRGAAVLVNDKAHGKRRILQAIRL